MIRLLLILLLLWPAAASAARKPAAAPSPLAPALYAATAGDSRLTLFGTVHSLPRGTDWFRPHVARALDSATLLVMETDIPEGPAAVLPVVMKLARAQAPRPVLDRVPEQWRPALQAALAELKPGPLDWYETWHVALTLSNLAAERNGLDPRIGAEAVLAERARMKGTPMAALETAEQQLIYFDALSEADQQQLLIATLEELPASRARTDRLVADWMAGDLDAVAGRIDRDFQRSPMLRRMLVEDRNARWAAWIAERMKQPGAKHLFVAVGAGHLAGPGSLVQELRKYGLEATRVTDAPVATKARPRRRR